MPGARPWNSKEHCQYQRWRNLEIGMLYFRYHTIHSMKRPVSSETNGFEEERALGMTQSFFHLSFNNSTKVPPKIIIGPLHDPVTWYKITHAGEQVPQWDFQNKGRSRWTGTSGIVLEVPLRDLLTSMCDFVPCDRIVQRVYSLCGAP